MMQNSFLQKLTACALMIGVLSLFSVQATHVTGQSDKNSESSDSEPAIKVGTATISKSEFNERVDRRVQRRKMRQKMMQQKMKKKGGKTPQTPEIDREQIKNQVKEQTIQQLVLEHHANKADIEVTESEINKEWQNLVDRFGSEKKLKSRLKKQGKNKDDLMSDLKDYLKMKKFIEKNTEGSKVTDKEVRDFYDKNKKRLGNKSFEDMKEQIRSMLEQRKLREARTGLVEDLRKKSDVEVNL